MITIHQVHNRNDIREIGIIHKKTFPGYFLSLLNEKMITDFYYMYMKENDILFVARDDDQIVGFLLGIKQGALAGNMFKRKHFVYLFFRLIALCITLNPTALMKVKQMIKPPKNDYEPLFAKKHDAFILSIGVLPQYRGNGIAKSLIMHFEPAIKALGMKEYGLAMKRDNDGARCFYERLGLSVEQATDKMVYFYKKI